MSLNIFGLRIYVSVPFCVMLAALLFMDKSGLMTVSLLAVAVHEAGHILMMKKLHCAPSYISFNISGMLISGVKFCDTKDNILIALSGPLSNLLLSAVFYVLYYFQFGFSMLVFSAVQFIVGAFNLLPVKGLDGGTVLREICLFTFKKNGGTIFSFISIFTACAIAVFGIVVTVKNNDNPSLLLLGIYLVILNIFKIDRM